VRTGIGGTALLRFPRVTMDEQHVALPKLYGAPAYARPAAPVPITERPFDPDELPIEAEQTDDEREFSSALPARAYAPGGVDLRRMTTRAPVMDRELRSRKLSLRTIADRLLGDN
jgi:hypothetical protein